MAEKNFPRQDGFRSRWGFILACIGSAVGMGNLWRFPIMVCQYGGVTFLLPYFFFVWLISSTGVIEEFALGRWAGGGPAEAFGRCTQERMGNARIGAMIGAIPILGAMMLAIGYTVVQGWIFRYAWDALTGSLFALGTQMKAIGAAFDAAAPQTKTLAQAVKLMLEGGVLGVGNGLWQTVGLAAALGIMALGIAGGVERANKVMMPVLFGLLTALAVYLAILPGTREGYAYIFTLQPEILLGPKVWIYAFGQAFFSLSVAGNGSIIYGSYLSREEALPSAARNVALFDTLAALLAALVILPAMAAGGVTPDTPGPGLMFIYLVGVINGMAGGRVVGAVFFVCVLFAAISSIINLYEAPVAFLQRRLGLGRLTAVGLVGAVGCGVSLLIQPWTSQWMDVVSIYICPLGAFLAGVMFFWVLSPQTALDAVNQGSPQPVGRWFYPMGRYGYCLLAAAALLAGAVYGGIG